MASESELRQMAAMAEAALDAYDTMDALLPRQSGEPDGPMDVFAAATRLWLASHPADASSAITPEKLLALGFIDDAVDCFKIGDGINGMTIWMHLDASSIKGDSTASRRSASCLGSTMGDIHDVARFLGVPLK
jgi:hypothetical protein